MKKLFAFILCLIMVFAFSACGSEEDLRGEITSTDNSSIDEVSSFSETIDASSEAVSTSSDAVSSSQSNNPSSEVVISTNADEDNSNEADNNEFNFGKTSGLTYKNEFLGLGCELKDGWTFYTDEQIRELNNIANSYTDAEVKEVIENATIIYDMYAATSDLSSNMNINLEKRSILESGSVETIKQLLGNSIDAMESTYRNMGYTNVSFEVSDIKVDGETLAGVNGVAEIEGMNFYTTVFCIKKGQYLASVTIASFDANELQSLLDSYYLFD
jgi:hypothetical protein